MNHEEQFHQAADAMYKLRRAARKGDQEATRRLAELARLSVRLLEGLQHTEAGAETLRAEKATATEWPAMLSGFNQIRDKQLERFERDKLGNAVALRMKESTRPRDLSMEAQTGLALDVFHELEAVRVGQARHDRHPIDDHPELADILDDEQSRRTWRNLAVNLEPLSSESLRAWTEAAVEFYAHECDGDWERFPWPDFIIKETRRIADPEMREIFKNDPEGMKARNIESVLRNKIRAGFKSLIRRDC